MKILCVTDQFETSRQSAIEGIFKERLREYHTVFIVYWSRELKSPRISGYDLYLPYRYKKRGSASIIEKLIDLFAIDIVIVRNFFPVLKSLLKLKKTYSFHIGFWNTFPHTFRRYFQAQQQNKAVFRKLIEYHCKTYIEKKLLACCDFLIVMSDEFKKFFFSDISIKHYILPMGFNPDNLPECEQIDNTVRKFIYTGTVDELRKTDLIVEAMAELKEEFVLDIYTQSDNETVETVRKINDPRITLYPSLNRESLLLKMVDYDVGIGLIPENSLYNVSSPTKTIEYYAVSLPAILNYLPEYKSLFDEESAFFCDFRKEDIQRTVINILKKKKRELLCMGRQGREIVRQKRNYKLLAEDLSLFLNNI